MTWSLLTSTEITKILDMFREYEGAARCLRCVLVRSRALAEQLTHKHAPNVRGFVRLVNPFSPWPRTYSSGDGPLKVQGSPRAESHLSLGKESTQVPQHADSTPAGAELTFPYIPQTEGRCVPGPGRPRPPPPRGGSLEFPLLPTEYCNSESPSYSEGSTGGWKPALRSGSQCHAP